MTTLCRDPSGPPPKLTSRVTPHLADILRSELTLSLARQVITHLDRAKHPFSLQTFYRTRSEMVISVSCGVPTRKEILSLLIELPQVRIDNLQVIVGELSEPHIIVRFVGINY